MASKYLYIFDPGHGGLINGKYQTAGKRSPKMDDGKVLFEGVNNRDNVKRLMAEFEKNGLDCVDIVSSEGDVSLGTRVARANALCSKRKCVYISIHSDAAGNGVEWHPASGVSVWTSNGQTKSDVLASLVIDSLEVGLGNSVKWRKDTTDGDEDKEENFYVLKNTNCPAILCELGFHTNKAEVMYMLGNKFKTSVVNSILNACLNFEKL